MPTDSPIEPEGGRWDTGLRPGQLRDAFEKTGADEQRNTIVHELIHCHLEPPTKLLTGDLRQHLGDSGSLFIEAFINGIEYGVDGLATAIASRYPLIDWPE